MMKILLASVVFNSIKNFLPDFFKSVYNQTYQIFDTLIIDDGLENKKILNDYPLKVIPNNKKYNFVKIRKSIIDYAIDNGYDLLVFCDADDVLSINRIEKIVEKYNNTDRYYGFYYNSLYYLKDKTKDFFKNKVPSIVNSLECIEKYNFLGMSNTSINLKKTKKCLSNLPLYNNLIAFDWFLHSYLLERNYEGIKVNTKTFYRIHSNNIAGNTNILTQAKLYMGIKVKKYHYFAMSKLDKRYLKHYYQILELERLLSDKNSEIKYLNIINEKYSDTIFWWENIKTLDELKEEKNDFF